LAIVVYTLDDIYDKLIDKGTIRLHDVIGKAVGIIAVVVMYTECG
jgi:hypothetical protein